MGRGERMKERIIRLKQKIDKRNCHQTNKKEMP
jgi:hypothetical protein